MTSIRYRPPWEWTEFGISGASNSSQPWLKPECSFCGQLCELEHYVDRWGLWVCPKCYQLLHHILQREEREIVEEIIKLLRENFGGEEP